MGEGGEEVGRCVWRDPLTVIACDKREAFAQGSEDFVGWAKRSVPTILKPHPAAVRCIMPQYVRAKGSIFFFTVVLAQRPSELLVEEIDRLRRIYQAVQRRHSFETIAICILPDHIHALWALPEDDADFSTRWSLIKSGFSRGLDARARSMSKVAKREKGIWQRRYWEHAIRDDEDFGRHVDYIHFNPVKHGHVTRVSDWPHSSFHRYVERGLLAPDWGGDLHNIQGSFGE
jgi:putative transposase